MFKTFHIQQILFVKEFILFCSLKYAIFKRSYIIIYIQGTQFFEKYTIL